MANDNRADKGQPSGGQFTAKTYTEDDVTLLSTAMVEADQATLSMQRAAILLRAKYVATAVLVAHPNAATILLEESDQEGCTWSDEAILDSDGVHIGDAIDLDLTGDFWAMPGHTPTVDVEQQDGSTAEELDPDFAWLQITHNRRQGSTAVFDVRAAAEIGTQGYSGTTNSKDIPA